LQPDPDHLDRALVLSLIGSTAAIPGGMRPGSMAAGSQATRLQAACRPQASR